MYLSLTFYSETHLSRHTAANKHRVHLHTQIPVLAPTVLSAGMRGIDVECLTFRLAVMQTHCSTYLCAPVKHVYYQRPLSETKSAAGNLGNFSYAAPLVAFPPCPTHTQSVLCLYKDMGAGHPSLTEKKENKDEIQVRSHPETCRQGLACEHRPPLRWGYCGVAKDSPSEFTLLEFHSCQHLKEISSDAQGRHFKSQQVS